MLDGSPARGDDTNISNVENNNPISLISSDGVNKTRQALLKKGGRKLRSTAPLHQQKAPRNSPNMRLSDHNNNNTLSANRAAAQPGTEPPPGTQAVLTLHHQNHNHGPKTELLKSKGGRSEQGAPLPGGQPARNQPRHDRLTQHAVTRSHKPKQGQTPGASRSTKRKETGSPSKPHPRHQPPPESRNSPSTPLTL